jgi:hypothetical protein
MTEPNILDVINIVASRLKQAEDSFEVFDSIIKLSTASKSCKNYLNDRLLLEISYKYIRRMIHNYS